MSKEHIYFTKGMHCASCEILIEKKLLEIPGVKSVEATTSNGKVVVEYEGEKPNTNRLNDIFRKDKYTFFENEYKAKENQIENNNGKPANATLVAFNIALFIVIAFLFLDRMGISGILSVSSTSSLFAFFGFGLLAGLSSCAALVGGIVLSMSKQWQELYVNEQSSYKKFQPHLLFNIGRILSYALLGGVLGLIGSRLSFSLQFTSFLIIAISLLMIALGLQMLGVKAFRKFQFSMPRFITRKIADEKNFKGKHMPFIMGALTFFLPCGFTITAQTIALLSGNALQGALIMGFFALGTAPMLLFIGLSSTKLLSKKNWGERFSKAAGFLVLFFALFNVSSQMNVWGFNFNSVFAAPQSQAQNSSGLATMVDGKQLLQMTVRSVSYSPNYFKVKVGVPVKWEITSSGEPGCDSGALVANGLIQAPLYLNPNAGQVATTEFTPQSAGTYRFSCPMGMVRGTIEVIN